MKRIAISLCYFVLTLIMVCTASMFVMDFIKKYNDEITKETQKIIDCQEVWKINRCDDPVPAVVELCKEKMTCGAKNAMEQIKTYNIMTRILSEMMNDISHGFTW